MANFPSNPSNGDTHAGFTYSSSVGAWRATAGVSTTLSNTAPSSPSDGDLWWNTNTSKLYISYDDGSSTQWVQAAVPGATGATGASGSSVTSYANSSIFPSSGNSVGDFAFATNTKAVYIWDGSEWDRISAGVDESPIILTEPPTTTVDLNANGTPTEVTMLASDPEGFDVTYGVAYNTAGSVLPDQLGSATTVNSNGVYTFTPTSNTSNAGSFKARLSASDGVKATTRLVDFSLVFTSAIEYLMVAGGGAGGNGGSGGGGGGAGGLLANTINVSPGTTVNVTVGTGGAGGISAYSTSGNPGSNSSISYDSTTIVTYGGGYGSSAGGSPYSLAGGDGGSGGGAAQRNGPIDGGKGVYPGSTFVDAPRQGYDGGGITSSISDVGGGGGGAGGAGQTATSSSAGGNGGAGIQSSITGTALYYAGGGGGNSGGSGGTGGSGVGGDGGAGSSGSGSAGATNTGSGGGGAGYTGTAGAGADGVVIFRTLATASATTGSPTVTTDGSYNIYKFTGSGSITF